MNGRAVVAWITMLERLIDFVRWDAIPKVYGSMFTPEVWKRIEWGNHDG